MCIRSCGDEPQIPLHYFDWSNIDSRKSTTLIRSLIKIICIFDQISINKNFQSESIIFHITEQIKTFALLWNKRLWIQSRHVHTSIFALVKSQQMRYATFTWLQIEFQFQFSLFSYDSNTKIILIFQSSVHNIMNQNTTNCIKNIANAILFFEYEICSFRNSLQLEILDMV